ncbi:MAG: hypothetical protein DELT_00397 [Desulfovibrio sp.]
MNRSLVSAGTSHTRLENEILAARRDPDCVAQVFAKTASKDNYENEPMWGLRFIRHDFSVRSEAYAQITFPIEIGKHLFGYISVVQVNKELDSDDLLMMRVAINTASIAAMNDSTYDIQEERRQALFAAIIDPVRREEAEENAKLFSFDYSTPIFCVIAQQEDSGQSSWGVSDSLISSLQTELSSIDQGVFVIRHNSSVVILCHVFNDDISKKQKIVKYGYSERLDYVINVFAKQRNIPKLRFGMGRTEVGIDRIRFSFEEALTSIRIAGRFDLSQIPLTEKGYYSIRKYYSILDTLMQDERKAQNFLIDILGPLMESKIKNKEDYYATLEAYLFYNKKLSDIYRSTGLHRNTVKYRICKIQEVLNIDLSDIQTSFSIWIALQIRKHLDNQEDDESRKADMTSTVSEE